MQATIETHTAHQVASKSNTRQVHLSENSVKMFEKVFFMWSALNFIITFEYTSNVRAIFSLYSLTANIWLFNWKKYIRLKFIKKCVWKRIYCDRTKVQSNSIHQFENDYMIVVHGINNWVQCFDYFGQFMWLITYRQ